MFFHNNPCFEGVFANLKKKSPDQEKNFLYKGVPRIRTGSDSVQKKYLSVCLVKNGALSML